MSRIRYTYPFIAPLDRPAGPYLPIRLINPVTKTSFVWHCLIDTGADRCLFTAALARLTDHAITGAGVESSVTSGIEGRTLDTYKHTFILELLDSSSRRNVVWRSRRGLFECLDQDNFPPLLGVADFLRHFVITLDYPKQRLTLECR